MIIWWQFHVNDNIICTAEFTISVLFVYLLQGITGNLNKIINVVAGFDALDDFATSTNVLKTMCGTSGSVSKLQPYL